MLFASVLCWGIQSSQRVTSCCRDATFFSSPAFSLLLPLLLPPEALLELSFGTLRGGPGVGWRVELGWDPWDPLDQET